MDPLSLSSTTTKLNLLSFHLLDYCGSLPSNLASLFTLYNPFFTQQPERSFYIVNQIILLLVLNLKMKSKPLFLALMNLQDLALA